MACMSAIDEFLEPTTYEQATKHPGWIEAMNKEINALQINNTWDVVSLPPKKKVISYNGYIKQNSNQMVHLKD